MALVVVPSSRFTWFKGCGTAEISDFKGYEHNFFSRLFDDACDEGFRIVSDKTGDIQPFFLACTLNDEEGDVQCWVFRPINSKLYEAGVRINLFND